MARPLPLFSWPSDSPGQQDTQSPYLGRERPAWGILRTVLMGREGTLRPWLFSEPQRPAWSPGGPERSEGRRSR